MLQIQRISTANSVLYRFMEETLVSSFPLEEYRDLEELKRFTDGNALFHNNVLTDNGQPVGILTYWDFGRFVYVEHFAIAANLRNKGYGEKALVCLQQAVGRPIVLEVEEPTNELTRRRIAFYQRNGFVLWEVDYLQPPYKPGEGFLPLRIMAKGGLDCSMDFELIKQSLYREVYRCVRPT